MLSCWNISRPSRSRETSARRAALSRRSVLRPLEVQCHAVVSRADGPAVGRLTHHGGRGQPGYLADGAVSGGCDVADPPMPPDGGFTGDGCGAIVRDGAGPLMTSKSKLVRPMRDLLQLGGRFLAWRTIAWDGPKNTKAASAGAASGYCDERAILGRRGVPSGTKIARRA